MTTVILFESAVTFLPVERRLFPFALIQVSHAGYHSNVQVSLRFTAIIALRKMPRRLINGMKEKSERHKK